MDDFVPRFKVPKTPLWSRLLGGWRARRRAKKARKHWSHIATVSLWGRDRHGESVCGYLQLWERGDGKRSCEFDKGEFSGNTDYKSWRLWNVTIVPWLSGRYDNTAIADWAAKSRQRA